MPKHYILIQYFLHLAEFQKILFLVFFFRWIELHPSHCHQYNLSMVQQLTSGNCPIIIPVGFRPNNGGRLCMVVCASDISKSCYAIIGVNGEVTIYGTLLKSYSYFLTGEFTII